MSKHNEVRMGSFLDTKQWYPPPDRKISPSPWFLPVAQLAFMGSTMLPRVARVRYAAPALLLLVTQTRSVSTGDTRDFLRAGHVFGLVMKFIDFGLLVKDGEEFKVGERESDDTTSKTPVPSRGTTETKGLWQRLKDSVELWLFTMRGIGWNWEVGGLPERIPQSNRYFLSRTLLRALGTYLAWDLCRYSMNSYAYIQNPSRTPFFAQPLLDQLVLTWLHQLEAFCFINMPYQLGALVTVMTGYQNVHDWPPLFGKLSDAYLVSKAWGRTWHQLLRRQFGILTPYAQEWLGATSKGARRTVSLLCSFTMSGLYHWSGVVNMPWTPTSYGMFAYFIMQAPVIRIEDYLVEFGKKLGIGSNKALKIVGYIWTFAWISFSMRYAAAWQYETGALSKYMPLKLSIIDPIGRYFRS